MNIPPLISRTPPPIHDVVDDEDQDEEDDESSFPSINFISPKSPEKTPDNLPAVCVDGFDYKVKPCDIEETNGINILNEAESSDLDTFQPPVLPSQKRKEEPSKIVSRVCLNETPQEGKCSSSVTNSVGENLFHRNIDDSIYVEPLQNLNHKQSTVSDLNEDFSGFQSFNFDGDTSQIKEDSIILKEEDVTPEGEIASPDSDYSCASEKALDDDRCYELDNDNESNIKNYLDSNNDDSKVTDVRLDEGQEEIQKSLTSGSHLNSECYCVDKCSCAEISDGECESGEQVNDNADSAFDDDSEFGEYKFESALPSESTDYINQNPLSSQFTSELYHVNIAVTKEIDTPPVETSDINSFPSEEPSPDNVHSVQFIESSKVNQDSISALTSQPVPAEFSVTFPDVVQNYQLDQPSDNCNDDDEFSDFVECTYEQCPVPEKVPHQSLEPHQVSSKDLENQISPILLLCLKEELTKTTVWSKLSSLEHTPALDYKWGNSYSSSRLLSALKIDSRNILSGHWTKLRKLQNDDYRGHNDHIDSYPEIGFNKASVPNPQFEWVGSGLINPLDDVSARSKKSNNTMLSSEAEHLISSFPDLSFIKQSFIVFPKNID